MKLKKTVEKIIGYAILSILFIVYMVILSFAFGLSDTLIVAGIIALIIGLISLAIWLIIK
ncbi:MAG: hypothetical protein JXA68_00220 [Ignavibacteriales bacterium]|nr:hypothetical protein [Ignavibacteriales bacterium]